EGLFGLWLLSALTLTVGVAARTSAGILSLLGVSAMLLDQQTYSNHLLLMTVLAALFTLVPSPGAWLFGQRRQTGPPPAIAYWPLLLIKLQISSMYAFAALAKLNPMYLSGEVLVHSVRPGLRLSPGSLAGPVAIA